MAARTRRAAVAATARPAPAPAWWTRPWVPAAGLALLCLVVYGNSFGVGFALDNRQLVLRDPRVHAFTRDNLSLILQHTYWWPYGESGLYRPLTTFSYLFNYAILGNADRAAGYHWFNLLVHTANVLLFWRVSRRITGDQWTAVAAAALWAVLPLSTEAVTNIVGRADLLAATGTLAALLVYLPMRTPDLPRLLAVAAALTLGVLSKESAVAAVGVLAGAELLQWRRRESVRRVVAVGAICAAPLAWWLWQRAAVLRAGGAAEFPFTDNPIVGASFIQGRLTAVQAMWRYVLLLVWPRQLSNDYSYAQIPLAQGTVLDWTGCLLLVGGALAALWQARRNRPVLFFAWFSFVTFLPVSNLLFATGTILGERLMYLPSAGLVAIVAVALRDLSLARSATGWRVATSIVCVLVLAAGARTLARNPDWTSDVTLWRSAVAAAPASAKAHRALAEALYDADPTHANIDEVMAEADRSVALLDALPDALNTFQAFRQAGAYYVDKANATTSSGTASRDVPRLYLRALTLLDRAVAIARAGAARLPGASVEPEADAQRLRAAALLGLENPALALAAADRSRQLQPLAPLGYQLSAAALAELSRGDDAAITLLLGSIVSGDSELGEKALALYRSGLDADGCAVAGAGNTAALNPQCPIVRRHSCAASAAAYQIFTRLGQSQRAGQLRAAAIDGLACAADEMERPSPLLPR